MHTSKVYAHVCAYALRHVHARISKYGILVGTLVQVCVQVSECLSACYVRGCLCVYVCACVVCVTCILCDDVRCLSVCL